MAKWSAFSACFVWPFTLHALTYQDGVWCDLRQKSLQIPQSTFWEVLSIHYQEKGSRHLSRMQPFAAELRREIYKIVSTCMEMAGDDLIVKYLYRNFINIPHHPSSIICTLHLIKNVHLKICFYRMHVETSVHFSSANLKSHLALVLTFNYHQVSTRRFLYPCLGLLLALLNLPTK